VLSGYFAQADCTKLAAANGGWEELSSSYHRSMKAAMRERNVQIRVESTSFACGSILTNSSVVAGITDVPWINERQAERPDLNHQQVLDLVIQEAWLDATSAGEVVASLNGTVATASKCRTSCGARDCGYMDDFCGGFIGCGGVVCPERRTCTAYGMCEASTAIVLRRSDTHQVSAAGGQDPSSGQSTSMLFMSEDPLQRGLFDFECKAVNGVGVSTTQARPSTVIYTYTRGNGNGNGTVGGVAGVGEPELLIERVLTVHQATGWEPCTSPHTVAGLENGQHTFFVRTVQSPHVEVSTSWRVDAAEPVLSFTTAPAPISPTGANATFQVNSTEPVTFLCDLDAGAISNPEALHIDRECFYQPSGCNFVPCGGGAAGAVGLARSVAFSYERLGPGRHNLTVRATDRAGNVGEVASWIFTLDDCIAGVPNAAPPQPPSCVASTGAAPVMAEVRQCDSGFYLDLDDDNICRVCQPKLGCTAGSLHCTNEVNSVCGVCESGFDTTTGENFYECEHVEQWPRYQ
jgi:hypothetical protein